MTNRLIRVTIELLDETRKKFESRKRNWDDNDSFPLSEGLEKYLETFAEDYDR